MDANPILPDPSALRLDQFSIAHGTALIVVSSIRPVGRCPVCGRAASRVHSHYVRSLQDLSWQGTRVTIRWRTRKFFCDSPGCSQRIFTEQIPTVTRRFGRRTARARAVAECLALALGGEAGSRVAKRLHLSLSADTLLRLARSAERPREEPPRVVSVDDWAMRRGQNYGTLIVDLQRHRPLALLPDRKWETFRDWLRQHPSVEVVSRDRADCYAHGATTGAPAATQIADRWHLLSNLRDALKRTAERCNSDIRKATKELASPEKFSDTAVTASNTKNGAPIDREVETACNSPAIKRSRRVERYQRVKELRSQGKSQRAIARMLGLSRETVRRYLRATEFPERAMGARRARTTPFLNELRHRWDSGCHNARVLTKELANLGYRGSYYSVRRRVAGWRFHAGVLSQNSPEQGDAAHTRFEVPSANRVAWLLFLQFDELEEDDQRLAEAIRQRCPTLQVAADLAHEFTNLFKQRRADQLSAWIERASAEHVPIAVRRFAQGLRTELAAVTAALTLPWSNGQIEGQINRLKLIKREMYGRANLDLLSQRFLMRPGDS